MSTRNLFIVLIAYSALSARAQTPSETPPAETAAPRSEPSMSVTLGKYVVTGSTPAMRSADLLTSVTIVGSDHLENESVDYPLELLNKIPGVYLTDFNQGIITADVSMRGFNGEGSSPHLRLLVDGIPHNLNDGYNDLGAIFPLEIEHVEVVKGTADARSGLNAVAGTLSVHTHQSFTGQKLKVMAGSFGVMEAQGLAGFRHGGFSHTYFAGHRHADGFRDHSELDKHSFAGKWFYFSPSNRWSMGLSARVHEFAAEAPGYLDQARARATPRASPAFSNTDGGAMDNQQFSLHGDMAFSAELTASAKVYRHDSLRNRFVRFTAAGSQQERIADETHSGVIVNSRWKTSGVALPLTVDTGVELHEQEALNQRFATVNRVRGTTARDQQIDLENAGGFVSADLRPTNWLRVVGALRADRFDGEFINRVTGARTPIINYGTIWQPKLSLSLEPRPEIRFYASYGRAFQIGAGAAAYSALPLDASRNDGYEVGVKTTSRDDLTLRLAVWRQTATDEVRLKPDNSGDSENIGETKREGVDFEATWQVHARLSIWGAYAIQQGKLVNPGSRAADLVLKGRRIDHIPEFTLKAGADAQFTRTLSLSVSAIGQGDYFLTPDNATGQFGDYLLVSADLRYRWKKAILGLHLKNAFDRYHEYVWHDGAQSLHSPGDGRALLSTVTLEF